MGIVLPWFGSVGARSRPIWRDVEEGIVIKVEDLGNI